MRHYSRLDSCAGQHEDINIERAQASGLLYLQRGSVHHQNIANVLAVEIAISLPPPEGYPGNVG
jgi:hypothetical protein